LELAEEPLVMKRRVLMIGGAVMALFAMAACGGPAHQPQSAGLPGTVLDVPDGAYSTPVWLADGWIYVLRSDPSHGPNNEVWRTRPGGKAERVNLPAESGCQRTTYRNLQALPDGRLGAGRWCGMEDPRQDSYNLIAFDPSTAKTERLAALGNTPATDVAWEPGLQEGYVSHGTGFCAGIARLSRAGAQRLGDPVTFDGHSWVVDFTWFRDPAMQCTADGRVQGQILRKDGKSLVLFASPTSQGKEGTARLNEPWNLYRWTPGAGEPVSVVKGLGNPLGAALAPDDQSVFVATRWRARDGVWRVDLQSGDINQVAQGRAVAVGVSPDGKHLVAVFQLAKDGDFDVDHTPVQVIDLG
jgi:hypothetical protein